MISYRRTLLLSIVVCFSVLPNEVFAKEQTGFLVVAPDRGFLGNQEIRQLVAKFQKEYPAALAFSGSDYESTKSDYAVYFTKAIQQLQQRGATKIVAIPLFLSAADPQLQAVKPTLLALAEDLSVEWAPVLSESHLIGQVFLDRVAQVSKNPENEQLIALGIGARDTASQEAIQGDINKLVEYAKRYKGFKGAHTFVYYHRDVEDAKEKNEAIKAQIMNLAAKRERTVIVPAFIGPKFDGMMSLTSWQRRQFANVDVTYQSSELMPHDNLLVWLKKTANQFVLVKPNEIGVVIMPHGSTQPYNDAIEQSISPLHVKYQIEMAYGMGDAAIIQDAVSRLEQKGIKRIVFARMYGLSDHMKLKSDYILGLSNALLKRKDSHHSHRTPPAQVRSSAVFSTFGGYEEYPDIAKVLHQRIMEISKNPAEETVILLAHGANTKEANDQWLSVINDNIDRLRKGPHCSQLKAIHAATVQEDWPEQRKKSVKKVRAMIEEGNKRGKVLVISNRLYGKGPYEKMLKGLEYEFNGQGFLSPIITQWLDENIQQTTSKLLSIVAPQNQATQAKASS